LAVAPTAPKEMAYSSSSIAQESFQISVAVVEIVRPSGLSASGSGRAGGAASPVAGAAPPGATWVIGCRLLVRNIAVDKTGGHATVSPRHWSIDYMAVAKP
jgi:hypothetical protein